ncbi:MAG: M50 family metallopeptidase [Kofleriaceae bacterium]
MTPRPDALRPLAVALVASVVLWQVPYGPYLLYPFKLLGTWFHEGSHALAMVVTGAGFARMEVFSDGSGLARAASFAGPVASAVIAAAGYMGTPLAGVSMVWLARDARRGRRVLVGLAIVLGATALGSLDNRFGQVAIGATAAAVAAAAITPWPRLHLGLAHLIAAQACIGAIVDVRVLFEADLVVDGKPVRASDAHAMALATVGTDARWAVILWASLWLAWSVAILFVLFRRLRRRELAGASISGPPAAPAARPAG